MFDICLWNLDWSRNKSKFSRLKKSIIKTKLNDINKQEWHSDVEENSQCLNYRIFKQSNRYEKYFDILIDFEAKSLCKFRCLNHKMPIVTGRHKNIPRNERFCNLCNKNQIGDSIIFFNVVSSLKNEKTHYKTLLLEIPKHFKMDELFNSKKKSILSNLAKFCRIVLINLKH